MEEGDVNVPSALQYKPVFKASDKELRDENFAIRRVACDDRHVLTGSWRPSVKVWKVAEDKLEPSGQLKHGASGMMSIEIADKSDQPDQVAATCSDDGCVVVWDLRDTKQPKGLLQGTDSSSAMKIKFLPGQPFQLASGGDSGNICFWDLRMLRLKLTRGYQGSSVSSCDFYAKLEEKYDAKRLKREDKADVHSGDRSSNGRRVQSPISSLALSRDGKLLGCGRVSGEIAIMWLDTLDWAGQVRAHFSQSSARVRGLAFDPQSRLLLSGGDDHHLSILDAESWTRRTKSNEPRPLPVLERVAAHRGWLTSLATSPDPRQRLVMTTSMDRTVRLWDYDSRLLQKPPPEVKKGGAEDREHAHTAEVLEAAWAPQAAFFVTVGADAQLVMYTLPAAAKEKLAVVAAAK